MKLNIPEEKPRNIKAFEKILQRPLTTEELASLQTKHNAEETLSIRISTENYNLFKEIKKSHKTNHIFGLMLGAFIEKYTKEKS